jgi:hypothetical protein
MAKDNLIDEAKRDSRYRSMSDGGGADEADDEAGDDGEGDDGSDRECLGRAYAAIKAGKESVFVDEMLKLLK